MTIMTTKMKLFFLLALAATSAGAFAPAAFPALVRAGDPIVFS